MADARTILGDVLGQPMSRFSALRFESAEESASNPPPTSRTSIDDHVILLDPSGRPSGTARKRDVHGTDTPLHLAVSCYVVRGDGRVLLTRRAAAKRTWPHTWTNACCGHPRPGESLADAVHRHMIDEVGLEPVLLHVALPDFTYRATMDDGCVEHELCPVFVAEVEGAPVLDPAEADALEWLTWAELRARAAEQPDTLSPWSVTQIERLTGLFDDPLAWVRGDRTPPRGSITERRRPIAGDPFARMGSAVDELIESFMASAELELQAMDPLAAELTAPLRELVRAGGKRLRPCLVHCGHAATGEPVDTHDLTRVAAAVEMLHTFALVHDDIMDQSPTRRGRPAAHVHFTAMHASTIEAGTRMMGDGEWFGASAAIVAGDLAFVWADELLDDLHSAPDVVRDVRRVFNQLRREVIAGQYLDLRLAGPWASDQQALSVALLKSARYTVTRPLELGAALGRATAETLEPLRAYGDAVGVAFQLRDDVLGVFGDPQITGKGVSEDLRSGKASLLLVRALELAAPAERKVLEHCLGRSDLDPCDEDRCRRAVLASGALASIEALIESKLAVADAAASRLPEHVANELAALAQLLAHREA